MHISIIIIIYIIIIYCYLYFCYLLYDFSHLLFILINFMYFSYVSRVN